MTDKMLLTTLVALASAVAASKLSSINQYDDNASTKCYLESACHYLAHNNAERYEAASVQEKFHKEHYTECMYSVWPKCRHHPLPFGHKCHMDAFQSFKMDDLLTHGDDQTSLVAPRDGFLVLESTGAAFFLFYDKGRPPMKLDILEKLSWPRDEDLLTFRDNLTKKKSVMTRRLPSNTPNVSIKLLSKHRKSIFFVELKLWITTLFDLSKYDFVKLRSFRDVLRATYPGIDVSEITNVESFTRVLPLHDPFVLIPPRTAIAFTYNHEDFAPIQPVAISKYSIIIAIFEGEGSSQCLVLSFDIL